MRCGASLTPLSAACPGVARADSLRLVGRVEVIQRFYRLRDRRGRFIRPRCINITREIRHNLVVTTGRTFFCERARSSAELPISHYALGTDATAPAAGQTTLVAESYRGLITRTKASNAQLEITIHLGRTQGNGVTYKEGGAFNAPSGGTMLARVTFSDKAKTSTNTLTVIHTITLSAS